MEDQDWKFLEALEVRFPPRTPEEIKEAFLELEEAAMGGEPLTDGFDVQTLVWDLITDLLDTLGRYYSWDFGDSKSPPDVVKVCHGMLTDYVANQYGDD